mmetsp:Transcript_11928/g.50135  ORF Transcript_11928/g.50135 Transcript_11928/m.50135 type:complete len:298 (+) Transcript_11928:4063-4956(+)
MNAVSPSSPSAYTRSPRVHRTLRHERASWHRRRNGIERRSSTSWIHRNSSSSLLAFSSVARLIASRSWSRRWSFAAASLTSFVPFILEKIAAPQRVRARAAAAAFLASHRRRYCSSIGFTRRSAPGSAVCTRRSTLGASSDTENRLCLRLANRSLRSIAPSSGFSILAGHSALSLPSRTSRARSPSSDSERSISSSSSFSASRYLSSVATSSASGRPSAARIEVCIGLLCNSTLHGVRPPASSVAARSAGIFRSELPLASKTRSPSHSPSPHPVKTRGLTELSEPPDDDEACASALS